MQDLQNVVILSWVLKNLCFSSSSLHLNVNVFVLFDVFMTMEIYRGKFSLGTERRSHTVRGTIFPRQNFFYRSKQIMCELKYS